MSKQLRLGFQLPVRATSPWYMIKDGHTPGDGAGQQLGDPRGGGVKELEVARTVGFRASVHILAPGGGGGAKCSRGHLA